MTKRLFAGDMAKTIPVVGDSGVFTLRYDSKLHHIGIGRAHKGERIRLLIHDRHIRIIATETGQILCDLLVDPTRDYQPQTKNTPTE